MHKIYEFLYLKNHSDPYGLVHSAMFFALAVMWIFFHSFFGSALTRLRIPEKRTTESVSKCASDSGPNGGTHMGVNCGHW